MMKNIITNIFAKLALVAGLSIAFPGNAAATDFTLSSASSVTKDGITVSFAKGSGSTAPTWYSAGLRLYASNTITISSSNSITGVTFNWEKQGNKAFNTVTASVGSYTHPTNTGTGTWSGSETSITFTLGSSGQLQLNTLSVTVSSGGSSTPTCATPSFSPEGGTYYEAKSVSISSTEGSTIYYTTDGSTPTTSSSVYSTQINVTTTTTIKAFAVKDNYDNSEVATATYTIKQPVSGYVIDFEDALEAYVDWEMTNIGRHTSGLNTAHSGEAWGSNVNSSDNGTQTAIIKTKAKVAYPNVFSCYISKESSNTTSSSWKIQVSSDGSSWEDVATLSTMTQNTWTEFSGNIKAKGSTDVYVRLYYDGSSAKRAVDDISLTTYVPSAVEAPSISVPSEFTFSTTATITCDTDGATIYYSFDNSNWTEYTEALAINSTTTIYAKAIKGDDESAVSQATATKVLATPNVTISATSINVGETATVSTDGPAVTLTTSSNDIASVDGATVTGVAAGSATITTTWSANADYNSGSKEFVVTVFDPNAPGTQNNPYTVTQAIANTPSSGTSASVYIHGIVSGFYNTSIVGDGSNYRYYISDDGTTSSQLLVYKGNGLDNEAFSSANDLLVGDEVTIFGGLTTYKGTEEVANGNYIVSLVRKPAAPTFSPAAGAVMEGTEVTISTTTDGATIYYTTDGTEPTTESSVYSAAIEINEATTIKAIAVKGELSSNLATAEYTIAAPVATPIFSPAAGTYTSVQNVEISCETEDATIYYTTNGDTPTTSSTVYSGAISVNVTMTIKAIAVKEGMANSAVAEAAYTINIPSIVFNNGNSLEVESSDTEASIAFTASFTSGTISVVLCDVNGDAQEYDWIIADIDNNNVVLAFDENTSTTNVRTAYFKLTADNATSSVFTLTQKLFVVDYAELPFEYDGNGTGTLPTGLTVSGTGTYDSSPKIKFDGTDDYVILKINEEPGTLTFDIKGNTFSGGAFKVQTSADGTNYSDLKSYMSLGNTQSEEFDNLNSNVRYIKWVYTNKSSGNVALGNFALGKPVASIVPAGLLIEASSEETDGTLNVTYKKIESKPEIQWFESNGETSASKPSWIETDFDSSNNVEYLIEENTGSERSAYFKVYGLDGSENGVYSELVTITQEAFVEDPVVPEGDNYTLFTGNLVEGDYIIYYNGYAMKNAQISGKSRLDYEVITPDNNVINTANASIVWHIAQSGDYWTLYNVASGTYAASNGTKNEAQMLADGTDDKALWSLESSFEFINKYNSANSLNCNLRNNGTNGFACYSTSTGGALSLYKLNAPETAESVNATLNGGRYWSTFYSGVARYKLPEGTKAYTLNASNKLYLLGSDGSVIPAGTAVIIISDTATPSLTQIPNVGAISVYGDKNILRGSSSDRAVSGLSGTPYVMGVVGGTLGFYKYIGETIPAGKAYYIVNE